MLTPSILDSEMIDRIVESEEVEPGVIIDYNDRGEIIGVEMLWFSRRKIDLNKLVLEGPEVLVARLEDTLYASRLGENEAERHR
ncbi:MAG: DUF2283 domain-containing protein [Desulfurococcales archaeon]|nr:DUF2283 domain-containing protein [Desulfurococcales archaeon]